MIFENTKRAIVKRCLDKAIQNIQCAKSKADANRKYGTFYGILELAVELDIYNWLNDIAVDYQLQADNALINRIGFLECDYYERENLQSMQNNHGKWDNVTDKASVVHIICSKCGTERAETYSDGNGNSFCDACGSKMDLTI